jgi:hypothetical protein
MKTLIPFLAALGLVSSSQAQQTFEKYYIGVGTATLTISEQASGNLFTGLSYQSGTSIMDPQGNVIHTHCYDLVPFLVLQSVRKHTDNEIYFAGGFVSDSCEVSPTLEIDPVIGKMDSMGNILAMHRYQLNAVTCSNTALDLQITSNANVITWGRYQTFFALRVDAAGAPLWSRQFPHRGSFGFIRELPGGDLLAGINMDTSGVCVARLDASGNFLWCKSYIRPKGVANDCLIESDSSFIITGYTDSIMPGAGPLPPGYHPKLFLMKLDGSGDIQWCRGYDSNYSWDVTNGSRIAPVQDGNYVILGNVGTQYGRRPFLMKTDLSGDTLWTRSAGVGGYTHGVVSLLAGADGGFYYDGIAEGNFWPALSAAYLFKTDSLGHLPCSETPPPPIIVSDLFPTDSSFTLTSVDGAVSFPITVPDAYYNPVVTYNGCTITSLQKPYLPNSTKPRIRPNPTTGHFTLQFADPLMAESYYSVYDSMGRLLYQRPLPRGQQTEEVDLSRYGKGAYVLKFTRPEGVCVERVVVE